MGIHDDHREKQEQSLQQLGSQETSGKKWGFFYIVRCTLQAYRLIWAADLILQTCPMGIFNLCFRLRAGIINK